MKKPEHRYLKVVSLFLIFILITLCFASCAGMAKNEVSYESVSSSSMSGGYSAMSEDIMADNSYIKEEYASDMESPEYEEDITQRKIIKTASLNLETQDFESSVREVKNKVSSHNGYISSSSLRGDKSNGSRYANFVCRIPSEEYEGFLSAADDAGNLTYLNESEEDVTSQYIDLEARISNLEAQLEKLNELLKKAETLEDMLTIENYIYDIQYQLDSYTGRMKALTNQISYCTVTVSISEVAIYTAPRDSFLSRIGAAFAGMWSNFVAFLQNAAVFLIYAIPYLVIALAVFFTIKFINKKKRAKKALQNERKADQEQNL